MVYHWEKSCTVDCKTYFNMSDYGMKHPKTCECKCHVAKGGNW